MRAVFILLSFLFACAAQTPIVNPDCNIDALENKFYSEALRFGISLIRRDIEFTLVPEENIKCGDSSTAIGCTGPEGIRFSRPYWATASCTSREVLFFHEMGHAFGKPHAKPLSVMQPFMLSDKEYLENREEFLKKFFSY